MEEEETDKSGKKRLGDTKRSEKRLKEELRKLIFFQREAKRRGKEGGSDHQSADMAVAATEQNGRGQHTDGATPAKEKRKRHRKNDVLDEEKQEDQPGSSTKRQKVQQKDNEDEDEAEEEKESSSEVSERWKAMPKKQRKVVQADVLKRLVKELKAQGRPRGAFPHTAEEHKLYQVEWKKAIEKRLDEAGEAAPSQPTTAPSAQSLDSDKLTKRERQKVRSQVRAAALKRWQAEEKAEGRQLSTKTMNHAEFNSEIEAEVDSKSAAEWRQLLLDNGGAAEMEEEAKHREEQRRGEQGRSVKRARRRVIDRLREQRKKEYQKSGKAVPDRLDQLFPINGADQKLLQVELAREMEWVNKSTAKRTKSAGGDDGEEQKTTSSATSASTEPEVIDLIDDDDEEEEEEKESYASAVAAAEGGQSAVSDGEEWAEETSARPARRAANSEDETLAADNAA